MVRMILSGTVNLFIAKLKVYVLLVGIFFKGLIFKTFPLVIFFLNSILKSKIDLPFEESLSEETRIVPQFSNIYIHLYMYIRKSKDKHFITFKTLLLTQCFLLCAIFRATLRLYIVLYCMQSSVNNTNAKRQ